MIQSPAATVSYCIIFSRKSDSTFTNVRQLVCQSVTKPPSLSSFIILHHPASSCIILHHFVTFNLPFQLVWKASLILMYYVYLGCFELGRVETKVKYHRFQTLSYAIIQTYTLCLCDTKLCNSSASFGLQNLLLMLLIHTCYATYFNTN